MKMARHRQKGKKWHYPRHCGKPMDIVREGDFDYMKCTVCKHMYSATGAK